MEPGHIIALIGVILGSGVGFLALIFRIGVGMGELKHRVETLEKERDHHIRDSSLTPQMADLHRRLDRLED